MIEIVTHCWAERYPQYATLLRYQLDSLVRFPPRVPVLVTVCFTPSDMHTCNVLRDAMVLTNLQIQEMPLTLPQLGRRSIGRDKAAAVTRADLVWFADVDYYFGDRCLDSLHSAWHSRPADSPHWMAYFPRFVRQSIEHEHGEAAIARAATADAVPPLNLADYTRRMQMRPIGGTQIVTGAYARERGYCRGSRKWQAERGEGEAFVDTREDVKFRKLVERDKVPIVALPLPNLFRIRHADSPVGRHKNDPIT